MVLTNIISRTQSPLSLYNIIVVHVSARSLIEQAPMTTYIDDVVVWNLFRSLVISHEAWILSRELV